MLFDGATFFFNRLIRSLGALLFCFPLLISCGGGGGGGGDSSASSGVRIVHGALDLAPVELYSSAVTGGPLAESRFAQIIGYSLPPRQEQVLHVQQRYSAERFGAEITFTQEAGERRILLIAGNQSNLGIRTALIDVPELSLIADQSSLRILHAVTGAAVISASLSGTEGEVSAIFGDASDYLLVPAGATTVSVRRAADQKLIFQAALALQPETQYSLVLTGESDLFVTSLLLVD